jgi:hypothetical protein
MLQVQQLPDLHSYSLLSCRFLHVFTYLVDR